MPASMQSRVHPQIDLGIKAGHAKQGSDGFYNGTVPSFRLHEQPANAAPQLFATTPTAS